MRRSERKITDRNEIDAIIRSSLVCRLAFAGGGRPYIVPLCFGLLGDTLYFHSASEGKKIDLLRDNPEVCFEFDNGCELVLAESSCQIGMNYQSVIGIGRASIVTDPEERKIALDTIVRQYVTDVTDFSEESLKRTLVFKVEITEMTGKRAQR